MNEYIDYVFYEKLYRDVEAAVPKQWYPMDLLHEHCKLIKLPVHCPEYKSVRNIVDGNYYHSISRIYKVQNPMLYLEYTLAMHQYYERGPYTIETLFHDTSQSNVMSIAKDNLHWKYGQRFKFGTGVYFSTSPELANRHSSKQNGLYRSMIVAEVLVQNVQNVDDTFQPFQGYDTGICHFGNTFVKFFSNEYYPNYIVDYISLS